jgi:hypothetical protein
VLFVFLLMISCFAITFFFFFLMAGPLFGADITDITSLLGDYEDPGTLRLIEYFQVVQSIGLFILPPLLAGFFFEGASFRYLRLDKSVPWMIYPSTILLILVSIPFINGLVSWNEMMSLPSSLQWLEDWMKTSEEQAARLTDAFLQMPTFGSFLFNMLMIAVLPAVGEELVFRGLFQRLFTEWLGNAHLAILMAAFLFSAIHMQFYGFIPRLVLGLILGYLFYFSGSLWVPILAHFIQNGTVVLITWLGQQGIIGGDYENFGMSENIWVIAISLALTIMMMWLVRYFSKQCIPPPTPPQKGRGVVC